MTAGATPLTAGAFAPAVDMLKIGPVQWLGKTPGRFPISSTTEYREVVPFIRCRSDPL